MESVAPKLHAATWKSVDEEPGALEFDAAVGEAASEQVHWGVWGDLPACIREALRFLNNPIALVGSPRQTNP